MGVYKNNNGELELISGATLYADAPIGAISAFGGAVAPNGWLLCQGQAISRTDYAELFAVIGTAYGSGDGSTTFNVPDLRDKFLEGSSATNPIGTEKSAGLPNIKGGITGGAICSQTGISGAFTSSSVTSSMYDQTGNYQRYSLAFNANKSNSIYSDNVNTVQPPAVCTNYIIKAKQVALPSDFMDALDDKQDATDNNLETTDKTVVGAINEVNTKASHSDYVEYISSTTDTYGYLICGLLKLADLSKLTPHSKIVVGGNANYYTYRGFDREFYQFSTAVTDKSGNMINIYIAGHISPNDWGVFREFHVNNAGVVTVNDISANQIGAQISIRLYY